MLRLAITTSAPQRAAAERHLAAQPAAAAGDQHDLAGQVEKLVGITHFTEPLIDPGEFGRGGDQLRDHRPRTRPVIFGESVFAGLRTPAA